MGGHIFRLREGGVGPVDGGSAAVTGPGPAATEKGSGQVSQGRSRLRCGEIVDLTGNAAPLGQPYQAVPGPEALAEDLQRAVLLPQKGNGDGSGPPEENGDDLFLPGGKIGKSVQEHVPSVHIARFLQVVRQLGHPVPPVLPLPAQPGLVGGVDERQVSELSPGEALHSGVQLSQSLRFHPVGLQLVKQRHQLSQEGRLPGGSGVHRQLGQHLLERQLHHEELATSVQCAIGEPPG